MFDAVLFEGNLMKEKGAGPREELGSGHHGARNSPLCSEVHELRGETVSWELGGWLLYHLFQLLEWGPPGLVREPQNGHLNLHGGDSGIGSEAPHSAPRGRHF